jgi:hypothetical protein
MATNRHFSLALKALAELKNDTSASGVQKVEAASGLRAQLDEIGLFPPNALFLGVASDALPVLLNLHDPHPGPVLVVGDAGAGKTVFLQSLARSLILTHRAEDVQFGVITNYPDEWAVIEVTPHHAGTFPVGHNSTHEFLQSLAAWAHANKNSRQCFLLLLDDLESVSSLSAEAVQHLRWLLLRGPARRVWPIVTMNAPRYGQVISWLPNFRTRIFGRVANGRIAEALTGTRNAGLDRLEPGQQFALREMSLPVASGENNNWLRFRLPGG